jgi:DNA-binding response OmpR family regulator
MQRIKLAAYSFASLAESKQIQIHFSSEYRTIQALFDPDILDKILNNLLSNAFKFTPSQGSVTVVVSLQKWGELVAGETSREKASLLQVEVIDTGIGIREEQKVRVFDRFYQVDGAQPRQQPGTGIGLALVRELVELQQGTITLQSEAGKGTRFTVQLPLNECDFELETPTHTTSGGFIRVGSANQESSDSELFLPEVPTEGNEKNPLMLLVEDNDEVLGFLRESFRHEFRLAEASDGTSGLKLAQQQIPDIIITDRMMPGMDGIAFCYQVKTDERTSHIPVIMLTAKASEESKIEGLETGADDYILKPFSLHELSVRVKNLIDQRKKLRERFTREVKLQPKDVAITSADEVFLQKAIRVIEAHMSDTDFSVETFVHEIAMSRVQLHRKLKALTDQSTSEFIRTMRLKRAAALLEGQYGNIAEVMYEVGFTNVSYFASSFKRMFGVTPSEYVSYSKPQALEKS